MPITFCATAAAAIGLYTMTVPIEDRFMELGMPATVPPAARRAFAEDVFTILRAVPRNHQWVIKAIHYETRDAVALGVPKDTAAFAVREEGRIVVCPRLVDGKRMYNASSFVIRHEVGHLLAFRLDHAHAPVGWPADDRADGGMVSAYGRQHWAAHRSVKEDFADAFARYLAHRAPPTREPEWPGFDATTATLAAFRAHHPARMAVLDRLYDLPRPAGPAPFHLPTTPNAVAWHLAPWWRPGSLAGKLALLVMALATGFVVGLPALAQLSPFRYLQLLSYLSDPAGMAVYAALAAAYAKDLDAMQAAVDLMRVAEPRYKPGRRRTLLGIGFAPGGVPLDLDQRASRILVEAVVQRGDPAQMALLAEVLRQDPRSGEDLADAIDLEALAYAPEQGPA